MRLQLAEESSCLNTLAKNLRLIDVVRLSCRPFNITVQLPRVKAKSITFPCYFLDLKQHFLALPLLKNTSLDLFNWHYMFLTFPFLSVCCENCLSSF